jgi:hypothetical protein
MEHCWKRCDPVSVFVMGVSGALSLDAAQTPYDNGDAPKQTTTLPGQEIHKVCCLAMLGYFKKMMWHGNS